MLHDPSPLRLDSVIVRDDNPSYTFGNATFRTERKAWAEFLDSILGSNGGPIHVSSGEPEHVAQPPSAGDFEEPPPRAGVPHDRVEPPPVGDRLAKPGKAEYRRNLPHLQVEGKTIFLTFCTTDHLILPESIRTQVLRHCLHDHGSKMHVHGVVVMPDHVHMVFAPCGMPEVIPTHWPRSRMGAAT